MVATDKCKLNNSEKDTLTAETQPLFGTGVRKIPSVAEGTVITGRSIQAFDYSYPASTNHPKSFTTTMNHAERLDSIV